LKFKSGNRWKSSSGKIRYRKWRTGVFQLNKGRKGLSRYYVCEKCGKKRKTTRTLHAHHIYSWEKYPNKRYTIKNGVVLCKWCHNGFHYKYKFEALEKPELLAEWIGKNKNKNILDYINRNNNNE
jgi:5-methylcytosine-specific restriction endonuclease McrA